MEVPCWQHYEPQKRHLGENPTHGMGRHESRNKQIS